MKYASLALILGATPAFAHSGPHLHPHDGTAWLVVVSALGLIAAAAGAMILRARTRT